ncbi:hypothetical protein [Micromonospora tulbaghiae]|uniref:hypothetical protein n=1 Tax=Micromonospora tulbaghiae TaxID=479978 RepID=UPI001FC99EB6|nr:hypothetical protein [Micromonospora tulbaghiae]
MAGAVDPGVEVLASALVADQGGEFAGEVGDDVEVRAATAGIGEISTVVVGEFMAGSHDPGADPPGRWHMDCGRRGGAGAVDGEPVPSTRNLP